MERIEKNKIHAESCDDKQCGVSNMNAVITAENAVSNERSGKVRIRVLYEGQYNEYEQCVFIELPGVGRVFAFDDSYFGYDSLPQDVVAELAIYYFSGYRVVCSCCFCGKEMIDNDGLTYVEIETDLVDASRGHVLHIQENVIEVRGSLHIKVVDGGNDTKPIESISLETAANKFVKVKVIDYECAEFFETEWGEDDSPARVCLSSPIGDGTVRLMSWMGSREYLDTNRLEKNINKNKEVGINISIVFNDIRQISLDEFMEYVYDVDSCEPLKVGVLKMENGKLYLEGIFSTCSVSLTDAQNLQWIEPMVDTLVYIDGYLDVDFENVDLY